MSRLHSLPPFLLLCLLFGAACAPSALGPQEQTAVPSIAEGQVGGDAARPPQPAAVALDDGESLAVVVTTNILGDVVRQVGGEAIDIYTMLPPGADPHSYQPTPQDLRALSDADVIFVNGLGLEEPLSATLDGVGEKVVVVNAGVETIAFGDGEHEDEHAGGHEDEGHAADKDDHAAESEHDHGSVDPHTWFSIHAVETWTQNIAQALSDLDPANADAFAANATAYAVALAALEEELAQVVAQLPPDRRKFVTDHDALGYLAHEFGFEVIGSVVPSFSTLSESSAQQLARLQEQIEAEEVAAILVGTTVSQRLERQLARDLGIVVVPIYTGSLSEADGPAASYLDFMRHNIGVIVSALE